MTGQDLHYLLRKAGWRRGNNFRLEAKVENTRVGYREKSRGVVLSHDLDEVRITYQSDFTDDGSYGASRDSPERLSHRQNAETEALKEAVRMARSLEHAGYGATINGMTLGQAQRKLEESS